jgi:hypothetical protein
MSKSICFYLFGKEANELFPKEDEAFVNESFAKVMHAVDDLVASKRESLILFDPTAFNNQCHLYALLAAQGKEKKFFYLSFFLCYGFLADATLMEKVVKAEGKEFKRFLRDTEGVRANAARSALNCLFEEQMKETSDSELCALANEDLQLTYKGKEQLYTFPKFAGVVYLIDAVAKDKIPLVFKVKVVTKEGTGSFSFSKHDIQKLDPAAPAIVFEMMATGEELSYLECHDIAVKCFNHSRRNIRSKDRHPSKADCLFCSPKRVDVAPFKERFIPILEETEEMLLALGADFTIQKQESFLPFFKMEKYPRLMALFQRAVPKIQDCFLSRNKSMNLTVSHVYADCAKYAAGEELIIDSFYDKHLQTRGLI